MTNCRLVWIEWEDTAQPVPGWTYLDSLEAKEAVRCVSVGWLLQDDENTKALAPNMGGLNSEGSMQVSGVIHIPTRCIVRLVELEEPGLTGPNVVSFSGHSSRLEQVARPLES